MVDSSRLTVHPSEFYGSLFRVHCIGGEFIVYKCLDPSQQFVHYELSTMNYERIA